MTRTVCMTVDAEDWYEGMAVLGHPEPRPESPQSGLTYLARLLDNDPKSRVTLFAVAGYARTVRAELSELAGAGHEIASHGPDHGRLPEGRALAEWLRRGREALEDVVQVPVRGFRAPRFDVPGSMSLERFRGLIAEAGYQYVSDTHRLGDRSPVRELPVLARGPLPLGGGSYQRLLPMRFLSSAVARAPEPVVLYYHSYDFGATLPSLGRIRSVAVARQVIGRSRIEAIFTTLLATFGSRTCGHVPSTV